MPGQPRNSSLTGRLIWLASLWAAAALLVLGIILTTLFEQSIEDGLDDRLSALMDSLISVSELDRDGNITLSRIVAEPRLDQPYSGWYWQIDRAGTSILRSRSLWDEMIAVGQVPSDGGIARIELEGPEGQSLRILAREILLPGAELPLTYIVAADRAELESAVERFLVALAISLTIFGIGILVAIFLQVRIGLMPLRRITEQLQNIRQGRDKDLAGDFPSEIAPLANELNALIAHNTSVMERARTHVGNLAHALKTPLSVLTNEAERHKDQIGTAISEQTDLMRRQVDHHLKRARTAARAGVLSETTEVSPVIENLVRTISKIHQDREVSFHVTGERSALFAGEHEDLEEMLGNLIDNACKWAKSKIDVAVSLDRDEVHISVSDDGPGLPDTKRDEVMNRGTRLDETKPGSGLGLSIVRDIAGLYGGTLSLNASDDGGLRAELALPGRQQ